MATTIRNPITRNLISVPPPEPAAPPESNAPVEPESASTSTAAPEQNPSTGSTVSTRPTASSEPTASTEPTNAPESDSPRKESSEPQQDPSPTSQILALSNVLAGANSAKYARYFLADYEIRSESNASIAALGAGTNPALPVYMIPDGFFADVESLAFGKMSWKGDPTTTEKPEPPRNPSEMGSEWKTWGMEPYSSDNDKRGPNPTGQPSTSLLDVEDVEVEEGETTIETKRAKCVYSIQPGIVIEWRRRSCWIKSATLSRQTIGKGWKIHLDNGNTWKVEEKKDEEGAWLWKDHEGKAIAVEYTRSTQWGFLGHVELRLLDRFDEHFTDFLVAAWVARVADVAGTLPKEKLGSKLGRTTDKLKNKMTLPRYLPMD